RVHTVVWPLIVGQHHRAVAQNQEFRIGGVAERIGGRLDRRTPTESFVAAPAHVYAAFPLEARQDLAIREARHASIDAARLHERERIRIPRDALRNGEERSEKTYKESETSGAHWC